MKNISTLSLSDLISGLNYLEDFEKEIDKFIVNSEKINKQGEEIFSKSDIQEMVKRLDSIREKNINLGKKYKKDYYLNLKLKCIKNYIAGNQMMN